MKFNQVIGPAALFVLLGAGGNVYGQHEEQEKQEKPQARPQPKQQQTQAKPPQQQRAEQPKPAQRVQQPKEAAAPQERQQHAEQPKPAVRAQQPKEAAQPQPRQQPQHAQSTKPSPQRQQAIQKSGPGGQTTGYTPPLRTRQQAQTWQKQSSWRTDGAWQAHASWQQNRSSNWQSDHRTWAQRGGYGGYYIPQASFSLNFGVGHWFRIQNQPIIVDGYPQFQYGGYSFLMVDPWPGDWALDWYSADDVYVGYDNGYYLYNRQYPGEAIAVTVML
jgi:hypothetical protein